MVCVQARTCTQLQSSVGFEVHSDTGVSVHTQRLLSVSVHASTEAHVQRDKMPQSLHRSSKQHWCVLELRPMSKTMLLQTE